MDLAFFQGFFTLFQGFLHIFVIFVITKHDHSLKPLSLATSNTFPKDVGISILTNPHGGII